MTWSFPPLILPVTHLTQQRIGDCLVACAGMLLTYAGKPFNYQRVASQLKTRNFGTVFSNIRHLNERGTAILVEHGDIDQIYQALRQNRPCAVAVNTAELPHWYNDPTHNEAVGHAVVVVGIDAEMIYLNDTEFTVAPLRVPIAEFQLARIDFDELYAVLVVK